MLDGDQLPLWAQYHECLLLTCNRKARIVPESRSNNGRGNRGLRDSLTKTWQAEQWTTSCALFNRSNRITCVGYLRRKLPSKLQPFLTALGDLGTVYTILSIVVLYAKLQRIQSTRR